MEIKNIIQGIDQVVKQGPKRVSGLVDFLAGRLELSNEQFVLLSYIISMGEDTITLSAIGKVMGKSYLEMLAYTSDIDVLVRRHYIRRESFNTRISYHVTREALDAIVHNHKYCYLPPEITSTSQFFSVVERLIRRKKREALLFDDFREELKSYLDCVQSLPIGGLLRRHTSLSFFDKVVLIYIASSLCVDNDDQISTDEFYGLFDSYEMEREIEINFHNGSHILMRLNLVEHSCENGIASQTYFCLTSEAKRQIFPGQTFNACDIVFQDVIKCGDIAKKRLFFNAEQKAQIEELTSLLKPRMFRQVEERLAVQGMRQGFACLFYGAPGTGKTETVLQLARITGRDVVSIDASKLKDKYVGESEKLVKSVFERYRYLYDNSTKCPILLFNEADAVFSKRFSDVNNSVDQMSNTCQNIILQEMERFRGILMATTNMNEQLDMAFERRFIYKIKFTKPDSHTRAAIWRAHISGLTNYDSNRLAERYCLSGGQIENVSRKTVVHYVLSGENATYEELCRMSEAEVAGNKQHKKIGF